MQYNGLTTAQVEEARRHGENQLNSKKKNSVAGLFFSQFKDLMILILAGATVVSALMGEGMEAITIIAIVLLNALMGFLQEYKTEKTLSALQSLTAPVAHVIRNGLRATIPAAEVVCGDVALLHAGDRIPADGELLEAEDLSADESLLTGESAAVEKKRGDPVFMGTMVSAGTATMRVAAVGMATEMGKIAAMMEDTEQEKTPLQKRLQQLGKVVAIGCLLVCIGVGLLGWLRGEPFLEMLLTGISLAVAAIPEGMPAIVTIVLALSVGRILKKGAIIRRLPAVETLGCAGVICSDKTGTITQNRMAVHALCCAGSQLEVRGDAFSGTGGIFLLGRPAAVASQPVLERLLRCAVLCSDTQIKLEKKKIVAQGNPTEAALLAVAYRAGITAEALSQNYPRLSEKPFDSIRKRMDVTVRTPHGGTLFLCKGAPDILLELCDRVAVSQGEALLSAAERKRIFEELHQLASQGCRVLAFAENDHVENGEKKMIFLGLAGLQDPPKPQVEGAVRRCRRAGMKPVMITGDYPQTAQAIAAQVGIFCTGDRVLTGEELEKMTDEELASVCMKTSVYARVTPQHKLRIVRAYQRCHQVVAMTGDGVNDAPAMKQADIGVAMNSGTDVTKEAGEVILLDDNFATIVATVEEGRVIYQNIRRFIRYLLTGNLGEVLSMLFSMLVGLPMALVPIQILMVNLLTDGLPAIALGLEPPDETILRRPPRPKDESLFAQGLLRMILVRGIFLGISTAGVYYAVWLISQNLPIARSAAFMTLILAQMVHIFECRGKPLDLRGNPALLLAAGMSALVTVVSVYLPAAQAVFHTVPVTGIYLLLVLAGIFIGPVGTAVLRRIRRFFV